jgi:hypothetical protein
LRPELLVGIILLQLVAKDKLMFFSSVLSVTLQYSLKIRRLRVTDGGADVTDETDAEFSLKSPYVFTEFTMSFH